MPFQYIFGNLLQDADDAIAVLFLDDSGEVVDLACSEFTPYEMKVVGAYIGIYLRQLEGVLDRARLGVPKLLHIEKESVHFYAKPLPDGYYLVLVQRRPALVGRALVKLERAREAIAREIFSEP